jgi:hypothetical protein
MVEERLPDCRPRRRGGGLTSASSHTELLTGDFAARPQLHIPLAAADGRATASGWYRRVLGASALVAAALIAISMHHRGVDGVAGAHAEQPAPLQISFPDQDIRLMGSTGRRP